MEAKIMVLKGNSPAIHKLGDIRRDEDDFIWVKEETEDKYIGQFVEGFGFIGVKFNKPDVRPCTKEEIDDLNKTYFTVNDHVWGRTIITMMGLGLLVNRIKDLSEVSDV
jgi:hypothetical protein